MKRNTFLITLLVLFLLASSALAMSSDNYSLEWYTPMTGNGGDELDSANYAVNFSVGQTAIDDISDGNYAVCLGYWCREDEAPCTPLTEVNVTGPTTGTVGATYAFTATVVPLDASLPITYTWSPPPDIGTGTVVSYTWATTGTRVITVTAENCDGVIVSSDPHTITITIKVVEYRIYLPLVLRNT